MPRWNLLERSCCGKCNGLRRRERYLATTIFKATTTMPNKDLEFYVEKGNNIETELIAEDLREKVDMLRKNI